MAEEIEADLSSWKGEHWSLVGPSWPGFDEIKYLIIFGDSYSQTAPLPQQAPTAEEPLGIPFPGVTYTEGPPNWVGYLAKDKWLLVHNYAQGGATVSGVQNQVNSEFLERHPPKMPWKGRDTIFVTWVGINDLAYNPDVPATITALFELQNDLYSKGARNFLFCDVPCIDRSPAYRNAKIDGAQIRFHRWNKALEDGIRSFVADKSSSDDPVTAIYFSSHKVFTAFLDHPKEYGFLPKDVRQSHGSIWMDPLHPTGAVHRIVASELDSLLSSIPAFTTPVDKEE